ncbi:MAG: TldD/PmbA family protein [Spirochaetaceae bacterium]|jgi:PmbA protein|nr:TldD/PmbA family protein [Spirochaetaceae bacterium]
MAQGGQREIEQFKDRLFAAAKQKGFTDYEIYYAGSSSFQVKVFEGEIREYKNSSDAGLSFRGTWKGKMGYAFTERIGDDTIPFLLDNAAENAEIIEDADVEDLYAGSPSYPAVKLYDESLEKPTSGEKIALALKMERAALEYDGRVEAVDFCGVETGEYECYIANSLGLGVSERGNNAFVFSFPRVRGAGGQVKVHGDIRTEKDLLSFDPEAFGRKTAEKALSYLGAESVPAGSYKTILDRDAMGDLLETFVQIFSAEKAQKGFSLLKGRLGDKIAAGIVSIRDDPLLDQLPGSAAFDGEGVAAKNKFIVENGVLKTFLHNRKTAKKDGVEPTGNGFKSSFKTAVDIAPSNFYITAGNKSRDELIAEMGDGLVITNLEGLHSGANSVSGDFSLSAEGFLAEGGRITRPVEQITVAGNFFSLLKGITAVASDIEFKGKVSSPSVLIGELSVAG